MSSICHLSVSQLSLNLLSRFLSNFSWGWKRVEMDTFEKKSHFLISLWIFQLFVNIRPYGSKNFTTLNSSLKSLLNYFNLFQNILLSGPHKSIVLDFLNFEFLIFHNFFLFSLTWDPMGAKTWKKKGYSLKSLLNTFKCFLNFLLSSPHKSTVLDFWNFEFMICHIFFFVFVNMGPWESFQTFSEFSLSSLLSSL